MTALAFCRVHRRLRHVLRRRTSVGACTARRARVRTGPTSEANLPGMAINDIAVDPTNAAVVIVALFRGSATVTSGARRTPSIPRRPGRAIDAGIPDVPVNAVLIDPTASNVLYLGTDVGIFRSTDGGASWQVFMDGHPNVAVFDLVANANTGTILSFTHGRSVSSRSRPTAAMRTCAPPTTYDQISGCQHTAVICGAVDPCHDAWHVRFRKRHLLESVRSPTGRPADDGNVCTEDACLAGACAGTIIPVPAVNDSVMASTNGTDTDVSWTDSPGAFNVYRGSLGGEAWSYNQTCFAPMVPGPVLDVDVPPVGYGRLLSRDARDTRAENPHSARHGRAPTPVRDDALATRESAGAFLYHRPRWNDAPPCGNPAVAPGARCLAGSSRACRLRAGARLRLPPHRRSDLPSRRTPTSPQG